MPKRSLSPSSPPPKRLKRASAPKKAERTTKSRGKKGEEEGEVPGEGERDAKGEEFWEISGKRRITISKFGGKQMVGIREYYEKDGEALPGKKGISLTLEQFNTIVSLLPHIETVLAEKGESIVRPDYSGERAAPVEEDSEEEEDGGGGRESRGKKNFEATSDEEE